MPKQYKDGEQPGGGDRPWDGGGYDEPARPGTGGGPRNRPGDVANPTDPRPPVKPRAARPGNPAAKPGGTKRNRPNEVDNPVDDNPDPLPNPTPDPRPVVPRPRPIRPARTDVFKRWGTPLRAVYGKRQCRGAHRVYDKVQKNGHRVVVYWLSWGPVNAVYAFGIDKKSFAQLGLIENVHYRLYLGTGNSAADPIMAQYEPSWATIAHPDRVVELIVDYPRPSAVFPAIDVEQIEFVMEGMLVRDPRTDPSLANRYYRDNLMLAIVDIETDDRFGAAYEDDAQDWTSIAEAADDMDADVGGGRKRYGPIGIELTETKHYEDDALDDLRGHGALNVTWHNGKRFWWVDKFRPSSGITFTDIGADANIVSCGDLDYKTASEMPTRVVVWFTNEAAGWKRDFVADEDPLLATGEVEFIEWVYEYAGIRSSDHAKRIARLIRKRASIEKRGRLRVFAEGIRVLAGTRMTIASARQWNWANQEVTVIHPEQVTGRSAWEIDVEPFVDIYDDSDATVSSETPPANPSPHDPPPDVVDITLIDGGMYCVEPQVQSTDRFVGASWSSFNVQGWDASRVDDGDTALKCFDWNVDGVSYIVLDTVSGRDFRGVRFTSSNAARNAVVDFSADGVNWTPVTIDAVISQAVTSGGKTSRTERWSSPGVAPRYWRFRKDGTTAVAGDFYDVHFFDYTGPYLYLKGLKFLDTRTGSPRLDRFVLANEFPSEATPISLLPFKETVAPTFSSAGEVRTNFKIIAVSHDDLDSEGVLVSVYGTVAGANQRAEYVRQAAGTVTLIAGSNHNVVLPVGPCHANAVFSGAPGAVVISGFDASNYTGGEEFSLYIAEAVDVTLPHLSANSSAGNRIATRTAASITYAAAGAPHFFRFRRLGNSGALAVWRLEYCSNFHGVS